MSILEKQKNTEFIKILVVLIKKYIEALDKVQDQYLTNDNQKENRKINCGENYPIHQSILS